MDREQLQSHLAAEQERDAIAEARIAELLEVCNGKPLAWPADTGDVLNAVQQMGYRCDGDYLIGLVEAGTPPVSRIGGRRKWLPWDCLALVAILESRRRWRLHPMHEHKMTVLEKATLEAEAEGRQVFDDLDDFSAEQLLLLMEQMETVHMRHVCRVALISKLRQEGWL